jgi:hypothetical protein
LIEQVDAKRLSSFLAPNFKKTHNVPGVLVWIAIVHPERPKIASFVKSWRDGDDRFRRFFKFELSLSHL